MIQLLSRNDVFDLYPYLVQTTKFCNLQTVHNSTGRCLLAPYIEKMLPSTYGLNFGKEITHFTLSVARP